MKVDFTQQLTDLRDGAEEAKIIGTLKEFCVGALLNGCFGDERAKSEDKVKRFELALKIKLETTDEVAVVDISSEDIVVIKEALSTSVKQYTPLVLGQCSWLLEGKVVFPVDDEDGGGKEDIPADDPNA